MLTTAIRVRHTLIALAVILGALAMFPIPAAYALEVSDPPTPAVSASFREQRVERIWLRQQVAHDRLGVMFDHVDQRLTLAQQLIDRADSNGKDVLAIQMAFNNFSDAVKKARPVYESTQGIISLHQGFDAAGNVTDLAQAAGTVEQMRGQLSQIRGLLAGPAQALRGDVTAFRAANQTP